MLFRQFSKTVFKSKIQQKYSQYQLMSYKNQTTTLLLILIFSFTHQASVANDYIWINYNRRNPVRVATDSTYNIVLPCQAKIGQCKISYTQIPPGWSVADDKSLLIPKSDVNKPGAFVVRATVTGLLGDRIDADMVVELKTDFFVVSDRKKFLQRYGYNQKTSVTKELQINRPLLEYNKYFLDGFPTLDEVNNLIKTQGVYESLKYINELASKQAPCEKKVGYLNEIHKALLKKILQNDAVIQISDNQLATIRRNIIDLQQKKRNQLNKQYNDKAYIQLRDKIKNLNELKDKTTSDFSKNQFLANSYFNNLRMLSVGANSTSKNKTKEQLQIIQIEDQIKQLQDTINKALQKKKKLEQSLKVKQTFAAASKATKPIPQPKSGNNEDLLNLYESKYREYSQSALQSKLLILDLQKQIRSLTPKLNSKNTQILKIEENLDQLKKKLAEKTSPTYLQLQEQLKNLNQIYIIGADNFKNKVNLLNSTTCL